jgi:hypothetical protein
MQLVPYGLKNTRELTLTKTLEKSLGFQFTVLNMEESLYSVLLKSGSGGNFYAFK